MQVEARIGARRGVRAPPAAPVRRGVPDARLGAGRRGRPPVRLRPVAPAGRGGGTQPRGVAGRHRDPPLNRPPAQRLRGACPVCRRLAAGADPDARCGRARRAGDGHLHGFPPAARAALSGRARCLAAPRRVRRRLRRDREHAREERGRVPAAPASRARAGAGRTRPVPGRAEGEAAPRRAVPLGPPGGRRAGAARARRRGRGVDLGRRRQGPRRARRARRPPHRHVPAPPGPEAPRAGAVQPSP